MKHVLLISIISALFISAYSQDCNSGYDIFGYNSVNISQNKNWLSVKFAVNPSALPVIAYYYKVYFWDFGDGSSIISKTVYPTDIYTEETHIYDLNNTSIINSGNLSVNPTLKIILYGPDEEGLPMAKACYTETEFVSHPVSTSGYTITLFTDPIYETYALNKQINLFYKVVTTNYSATDNLSYSLKNGGTEIKNGPISVADLNKNTEVFSFLPTQTGSYTYNLELKRSGNSVGFSNNFIIKVGSDTTKGSSAPVGSCLCCNLQPDLKLSYEVLGNGNVSISILDVSSADYMNIHSKFCSKYGITAVYPDGSNPIIVPLSTYSYGYGIRKTVPEPGVFDSPKTYTFITEITCKKTNGEESYDKVSKSITIPPHTFSPAENTINIDPKGQQVTIPTYTNLCLSTIVQNPIDLTDELTWMENFNQGSNITFSVGPNNGKSNRAAQIMLFVNGNYDKCVDVVNGEKKSYRTINVNQPTSIPFVNINPMAITSIKTPALNIPPNTDYYSISFTNSQGYVSTYYFKDIKFIPAEYISSDGWIKVHYYDRDGLEIGFQNLSTRITPCNNFSIVTVNHYLQFEDILIANNVYPVVNLDSTFKIRLGKSFTVFCSEEINLDEGFDVPEGSFFEAGIQGCVATKSARDTVFENIIHENTPAVNNDSIYQPENIIIYPNPNNGSFVIENRKPDSPMISVEILNDQGVIIKKINRLQNIQEINIKDSPAGLYILKVRTSNAVWQKKIIINTL